MEQDTIFVLTAKQLHSIFHEGGSGDWVIGKPAHDMTYIVCTSSAPYDRGRGFLVGKISEIVKADTEGRVFVGISEYAEINIPHLWKGSRNPAIYENLAGLGIDANKLDWKPLPKFVNVNDMAEMSIDAAKLGLSKKFGVPTSSIKITIEA